MTTINTYFYCRQDSSHSCPRCVWTGVCLGALSFWRPFHSQDTREAWPPDVPGYACLGVPCVLACCKWTNSINLSSLMLKIWLVRGGARKDHLEGFGGGLCPSMGDKRLIKKRLVYFQTVCFTFTSKYSKIFFCIFCME